MASSKMARSQERLEDGPGTEPLEAFGNRKNQGRREAWSLKILKTGILGPILKRRDAVKHSETFPKFSTLQTYPNHLIPKPSLSGHWC